ncbi:MAG: hypothetical protein COV47_02715 [Candidatus Diapherotrites archaeon CG11_big_fil_rev_8_21_14_0_20_37_9]|nr:MAG: hypothetical protein COV47_02715 [Candidatus Diapherotrites archaeon CG11_big_fil_rev_8_21_14_0_20_37_9]
MDFSFTPETFFVEEVFNPVLGNEGKYYYYTLKRSGMSHKHTITKLNCRAFFSGIKDKNATITQWFCTLDELPEINEHGFSVKFEGRSDKRIRIGIHKSNFFKLIVDLSPAEFVALKKFGKKDFICNYFGEQRFDLRVKKFSGFLESGDFESALKFFITEPGPFDTEKSSEIKSLILNNWGNWDTIISNPLISETKKVLVFMNLKQGVSFRNVFSFLDRQSLTYFLKACQSMRFNDALNSLALSKKPKNIFSTINGQSITLAADSSFTRYIEIEATSFERDYGLKKLIRKTFFSAKKFCVKKLGNIFEISFELPSGCYATVCLDYLKKSVIV